MLADDQRLAHNAYMRQWKKDNKDKVNAINRAVKAKKPEKYKTINRVSMARMRKADPDRFAATRLKFIDKNTAMLMWRRAKGRADSQGLVFTLAPEDIAIPEFCPVLGIRLECDVGRRLSHNRTSPSLDRIFPEKGYTKDNVRVISNRANHLKNNGSLEEFRAIVGYLEREGG